jgi:hypothetical protein
MVGAAIAVVFNVLHPRSSDLDPAAVVSAAADNSLWAVDHYMLGWTIGLALLALVVITHTLTGPRSQSWGRVALWFAVGGTAIAFVTIVVDGFALSQAAQHGSAEVATAVAYVGEGLFVATIGSFFGITPVVYGVALLTGDDYPSWLGWTILLAGTLGVITGSIVFFAGPASVTINVLFPISSLITTLWIGVMGYRIWQKLAAELPPTASGQSEPALQ